MNETEADRQIDCCMRRVAAQPIEDAAEFGNAIGHARELAVRGVDYAVENEDRERDQTESLVIKQSAADHSDNHANNRERCWRCRDSPGGARNQPAERPEKINVTQLLDLGGLEGEVAVGHDKAAATTRFRDPLKTRLRRWEKSKSQRSIRLQTATPSSNCRGKFTRMIRPG